VRLPFVSLYKELFRHFHPSQGRRRAVLPCLLPRLGEFSQALRSSKNSVFRLRFPPFFVPATPPISSFLPLCGCCPPLLVVLLLSLISELSFLIRSVAPPLFSFALRGVLGPFHDPRPFSQMCLLDIFVEVRTEFNISSLFCRKCSLPWPSGSPCK